PCPHFHKDDRFPVERHDVDFPQPAAPVSGGERMAALLKMAASERFPASAEGGVSVSVPDRHHGRAALSVPGGMRRSARYTKLSSSATSWYSSGGIASPTSSLPSTSTNDASSCTGTPCFRAVSMIFSATRPCPLAVTTGASCNSGLYFSATAFARGFGFFPLICAGPLP